MYDITLCGGGGGWSSAIEKITPKEEIKLVYERNGKYEVYKARQ